jgi:hypothetical protein
LNIKSWVIIAPDGNPASSRALGGASQRLPRTFCLFVYSPKAKVASDTLRGGQNSGVFKCASQVALERENYAKEMFII